MRILLLIAMALIAKPSPAQKIILYEYNKVDTVYYFKNAEVIVYKQNNTPKRDTIYFATAKRSVSIAYAEVVLMDNDKIIRLPKRLH